MSETKIGSTKKKVLKLEGNLSIYEAGTLKERFINSLKDTDLLEIDMTNCIECDTSLLQVLCSGKKTADHEGKRIVLSCISETVEAAMIKTGVTKDMISHNGGTGCQR